ncbi:hypothetical protein 1 [Hubei odonate virus 10]|uniref:Uncharacterized protein n=1 Tax=Hubei odonate virus 10 TaxID=1922991 RepID=A0A1L3KMT6_9MONO|nr:hypothetical protein 1 [Hubei odonate virus 10]APG78694.1 hypothetical protein 1 [Hubei odonate virus 10]
MIPNRPRVQHDDIYNVLPRAQAAIGDPIQPPLLQTIRDSHNLGHQIQGLQMEAEATISDDIPLTSDIPQQIIRLVDQVPTGGPHYDDHFHLVSTWILHLTKRANNNSPSSNLSLFFSSLCHYMPRIRHILKTYATDSRTYQVVELPLGDFLNQHDAIDINEENPDGDVLCSSENDKGRLTLGLNCLLIGKHINTVNHQSWFEKRIKSISGTLSIRQEEVQDFPSFDIKYCQDVYGSLSAHKLLRSRIFTHIHSLVKDPNSLQALCVAVCGLLSGCEMTSFLLAYRVLLCENPTLFYLYDLNSIAGDLQVALKVFRNFGDMRLFAKLLLNHNVGRVFNTPAISKLAKVARALALDAGEASLANYTMSADSEGERTLIARVREFRKLLSGCESVEGERVRSAFMTDSRQNEAILKSNYSNHFPNVIAAEPNIMIPTFNAPGVQRDN